MRAREDFLTPCRSVRTQLSHQFRKATNQVVSAKTSFLFIKTLVKYRWGFNNKAVRGAVIYSEQLGKVVAEWRADWFHDRATLVRSMFSKRLLVGRSNEACSNPTSPGFHFQLHLSVRCHHKTSIEQSLLLWYSLPADKILTLCKWKEKNWLSTHDGKTDIQPRLVYISEKN